MGEQAERLDRQVSWVDWYGPMDERSMQALYTDAPEDFLQSSDPPWKRSSQPAVPDQGLRNHREASLLFSRLGGGGMLAAGFNPSAAQFLLCWAGPFRHANVLKLVSLCESLLLCLCFQTSYVLASSLPLHSYLASRLAVFVLVLAALVLTHERAPTDLREPYLAHRLRPLRPLTVYGRDRSSQPRCLRDRTIWYAWKDRSRCMLFLLSHSLSVWGSG